MTRLSSPTRDSRRAEPEPWKSSGRRQFLPRYVFVVIISCYVIVFVNNICSFFFRILPEVLRPTRTLKGYRAGDSRSWTQGGEAHTVMMGGTKKSKCLRRTESQGTEKSVVEERWRTRRIRIMIRVRPTI